MVIGNGAYVFSGTDGLPLLLSVSVRGVVAFSPVSTLARPKRPGVVVSRADLLNGKAGFGIASGATFTQSDANRDGNVDGEDDFAWQGSSELSATMFPSSTAGPGSTSAIMLCLGDLSIAARRNLPRRH
jgi:hypothetical protein